MKGGFFVSKNMYVAIEFKVLVGTLGDHELFLCNENRIQKLKYQT